MTALPKATSQGLNGAGAGAGGAFSGISAANDEPAVIASTAAAKTSFFMTIPITLKTAQFPTPQGESDNRLRPIPERKGNLVRTVDCRKQKRRSSADFLGVLAYPRNVVSGCCIRTTFLAGFSAGWDDFRVSSPEQTDRRAGQRTGRISRPVRSRKFRPR